MKQIKYFIPAIVWMGFIFIESAMPAHISSGQSNIFVDLIINWLPGTSNYVDLLSFIIRKCAHISEYMILTLLIYYGFYKNNFSSYLYICIISILYACIDEFHQLFVPGRAGMIQDVMIDSIGIIFALFLIWLFINKKQLNKKEI